MRRKTTTKEMIRETLFRLLEERSIDDITVKMLCMEAGISKQTLYNHYYCIMDALEDSYAKDFLGAVAANDTYCTWAEGFQGLLDMLSENSRALIHVYDSNHRDEFMDIIRRHGEALVRRGIDECARDIGIGVSDRDCDFMTRFYMYVFMGILRDYFENRMRDDTAYITSRCDAMLRHHIRRTLFNISAQDAGRTF